MSIGSQQQQNEEQSRLDVWQNVYRRALAAILILLGLYHWAVIVGIAPAGEAATLAELSGPWQWATINLAVAYLVAAVGLWMLTSWGLVIWLYAALFQIAMHTIFAGTFGIRLLPIAVQIGLIGVYFALLLAAVRAEADRSEKLRANRNTAAGERLVGSSRFTAGAKEKLAAALTRRRRDADQTKPADAVDPR